MAVSKRLASASICAKLVPSGIHSSTISSGRLESGKNCFSTNLNAHRPSAKLTSVTAITVLRHVTHQFTRYRKRA
ncbi:hypothetical protein D3C81_1828430 [compost metagenome]